MMLNTAIPRRESTSGKRGLPGGGATFGESSRPPSVRLDASGSAAVSSIVPGRASDTNLGDDASRSPALEARGPHVMLASQVLAKRETASRHPCGRRSGKMHTPTDARSRSVQTRARTLANDHHEVKDAGAPAVMRTRRVGPPGRCGETAALPWHGQIARATRGRDLHLNVPFPRKQPDLLMAESPPTGGLSALNGHRSRPCCAAPVQRSTSARPFRTLPIDARGAVCDASLEDGLRPLPSNSPSSPSIAHSTSERGAGRRCLRAGCRSTWP